MANISLSQAFRKISTVNKKYIDSRLVFDLKSYLEALTLVTGETYVYNITTTQIAELKAIFDICVKVIDLNGVTRLINNVNVSDGCIEINTINSDSTDNYITIGDIYLSLGISYFLTISFKSSIKISLNTTSGYVAYYHNFNQINVFPSYDASTGDLTMLNGTVSTVGEKFN